ncbi:MAG: DUF2339 domain-containing protein [Ignavibacteria bacterium]|nr:DUF2339 domain-containing protein [Ignavibacteria bacterium]
MLIGGKLLNRIGALAIVLAVIFFLKYAFDNDLIPPIGRVMIGFAAGSALMYAAHRWMKKGLDGFAQGLVSASITILYLSAYATYGFYEILPQPLAFVLMIGVTCLAVWRAIAHNSLAIVIMAAIGGLTTPAWLSTGEMNTVGLFTYLSLLSVGLYALALWKDTWRPVAFITSLGLVTWWMSWSTIIGAGDDVIIGSVFLLLTMALGLGYHYRRAAAESTMASLELVHTSLHYGLLVCFLAVTTDDSEQWIQHLFLSLAAIIPFVLVYLRASRVSDPVFHGVVASAGIITLSLNGVVVDDPNVSRIVGSVAALVGYVAFRRLELIATARTALALSGGIALFFALASDGALMEEASYLPVFSMRTLTYIVVIGATVFIARSQLLLTSVRTRPFAMLFEIVGWITSMMFIYVEVRDAVMNTLIGGSEHIQYAACGVGLAATAATSAGVWLITGYRNSGPLTFAAVIMSYIVAAAWIIEMSWFRLNADYTAFINVRMGTGLIVALALSVFFWRPNHTISQVYRTIAALGIVATTFILASTESVWSLWIAYVNAQTTYDESTLLNELHLVLSGVWILYGIVVVVIGFLRDVRSIRLGGIALLGLAILKVFLYDLNSLEQPYRIVSFIALGVILLGASYLYTRYRSIIIGSSSSPSSSEGAEQSSNPEEGSA